ncbi:MAG: stage V sporulation protein AC [Bacillota bacterium]
MKNINKTRDEYKEVVKNNKPGHSKVLNFIKAYFVGGFICLLGQGFWNLYLYFNMSQNDAGTMSVITLIFLGGLLTGLGVYDEITQFSGGGSIVPITGFANAMVSPAMEYKQDGMVLGLGANLFKVAGPVLAYGMVTSFIMGTLKIIL